MQPGGIDLELTGRGDADDWAAGHHEILVFSRVEVKDQFSRIGDGVVRDLRHRGLDPVPFRRHEGLSLSNATAARAGPSPTNLRRDVTSGKRLAVPVAAVGSTALVCCTVISSAQKGLLFIWRSGSVVSGERVADHRPAALCGPAARSQRSRIAAFVDSSHLVDFKSYEAARRRAPGCASNQVSGRSSPSALGRCVGNRSRTSLW
jgi:hypothetical protein